MAAQTFIRWSHHGVWERLLELAQQREGLQLGMAFLDGTTIRAHQKAAGAAKQGESSAQRDRDREIHPFRLIRKLMASPRAPQAKQ